MQAQAAQQIVSEMNAHMTQSGIPIDRWYVGVARHWTRIFSAHNVARNDQWFICRWALTYQDARAIQEAYQKAGSAGPTGEEDAMAEFVYAYVITPQTVQ